MFKTFLKASKNALKFQKILKSFNLSGQNIFRLNDTEKNHDF